MNQSIESPYTMVTNRFLADARDEIGIPGAELQLLGPMTGRETAAQVAGFLARNFSEREPLTRILDREDPSGTFTGRFESEFMLPAVRSTMDFGYCLVLINHSGELIGVILALEYSESEYEVPEIIRPIGEILNQLHRKGNEYLAGRWPRPKVLNYAIGATGPGTSGFELVRSGTRLINRVARSQGYTDIVSEATSHSQIALKRYLGMKTIAEVSYAEIPIFSEIARPSDPRRYPFTHAKFMWNTLEDAERCES